MVGGELQRWWVVSSSYGGRGNEMVGGSKVVSGRKAVSGSK